MKEYTIIILLLAAVITAVAVAAGAIVYIRARYGADSLTFQLSRIGILWGAAILILLLLGALGACVTDWTLNGVKDVGAWLLEHNPVNELRVLLMRFLDWGYDENPWSAWLIVWAVALTVMVFFIQRHLCTPAVASTIVIIALAMSGYIWRGATFWFAGQAVIAIIVMACAVIDGSLFKDQYTWSEWRERRKAAKAEAEAEAMAAKANSQSDDPGDPDVPDHHRPVEALGEMVAECFDTLANQ